MVDKNDQPRVRAIGCGARSTIWGLALLLLFPMVGNAGTIVFEGSSSTTTTGELFENVSNAWATNQVVEFQGLELRARTDDPSHTLNANNGYFGINSDLVGERADAFDAGEKMVLSFDSPVRIDLLDFNLFDSGEEFTVTVGGQNAAIIAYDDLDNKSSDYIGFDPGIIVSANTEIRFFASSGTIGLDAMGVTVIPEPAVLSFVGLVGVAALITKRFV